MSDVDNTTNELEVDGSKLEEIEQTEEKNQEEELEEVEKPTEEQEKESLFSKIKKTFYGEKKTDKAVDEETEEKEEVREDLEEDIDNDFTQAALKAGWTEKDVVKFAGKYSNSELKDLIPYLVSKEETKEKEEQKNEKEEEKVEVDKNLEATVDKLMKALDAKYQEKIGQLEERLSKVDEERSVQEQVRYQTTADKVFDRAAKNFPVFGKTEELLRFPEGTPQAGQLVPAGAAYESRNAVWKTAVAFNKMGMPWEAALDEALDWYKGKNMEKEIHGKVVKELKNQQKRLSPKRAEHVTEKKYTSDVEEKSDVVLEAARKAGVKGI